MPARPGRPVAVVHPDHERVAGAREDRDRLGLIHYAQCMRSHAIPMLDPTPLGDLALGNVPGISSDFGRYTPEFHAADHACRRLLPATISDDGTGP